MISQKEEKKISYVWTVPEIKKKTTVPSIDTLIPKGKDVYAKSSLLATIPVFATATVSASQGVFWDAFLEYIFPWMLDIAKVFCAIKIAQAFYQEKRGGRDEGSGMGAMVTYGKWLLIFHLIPWGVTLIDQLGGKMFMDLKNKGI